MTQKNVLDDINELFQRHIKSKADLAYGLAKAATRGEARLLIEAIGALDRGDDKALHEALKRAYKARKAAAERDGDLTPFTVIETPED